MASQQDGLIAPHGGVLVNRVVEGARKAELESAIGQMVRIELSEQAQCDVEMIAVGAFSPLTGFMGKADVESVCNDMKLSSGLPWGIPITCAVAQDVADSVAVGQQVCLVDEKDRAIAVLTVEEKFEQNKKLEAEKVYLTDDLAHPGVKVLMESGPVCLAGPLDVLTPRHDPEFADRRLTPAETRAEFARRGWKTIVAFQTRNPIHRAHEYLTKCALEICDGLLIHPLVGQTQPGDIPADVRMKCYDVLIENHYNVEKVLLSCMPSAMRYAGPREAILHATIRKNYGCSHFIVGRDHAGVGDYYGTYDAQLIFDKVDPVAMGIEPLKFEHNSYCTECQAMVSPKICPHGPETKVFLSGTKVRELLSKGERPPAEFSRPEVADVLVEAMKQ